MQKSYTQKGKYIGNCLAEFRIWFILRVNVVDVNNKDLSTFMHLMNERIQVWYKSNYKNFKIKQRVAKLYTKFRQ
jgi:hypothetical protein